MTSCGHRIGVLLVRVAGAADAAAEVHARALLDDVRRLVRHRMQVSATIQDDVIARRVRPGAHLAGARGCVLPRVRLDPRDVVLAERALDLIGVG